MGGISADMTILPFADSHAEQAAVIEQLCFSEPWSMDALRRMYMSPNTCALVCVDSESGTLAAYAGMEYVLDEGQVINVATHPDFRRRGCAEALMRALEEFSLTKGLSTLWLDVSVSNLPAQSLYNKLGYLPAGTRRHYYRFPAEDALEMVKYLKTGTI